MTPLPDSAIVVKIPSNRKCRVIFIKGQIIVLGASKDR